MESFTEDEIEELEAHKEQIQESIQAIESLLQGSSVSYTAERTWLAQLKMAVSQDHDFMGGSSETLADTIEQLRNEADEEDAA
jgi:hypothetical protein